MVPSTCPGGRGYPPNIPVRIRFSIILILDVSSIICENVASFEKIKPLQKEIQHHEYYT
jgi:hypothetical protein